MDSIKKTSIEIFKIDDDVSQVEVRLVDDNIWLSQKEISELFNKDRTTINRHINNIFKDSELNEKEVCAEFAHTTIHGAISDKTQTNKIRHYNLDMIISVGYRVNSKRATQFRIWATSIIKDYLIKGCAINEERLKEKQEEVEFLKSGIRIVSRAIDSEYERSNSKMLSLFSKGLELLDDYDHETLDEKGHITINTNYPTLKDYMDTIKEMYSDFESDVFAKPKDKSFESSINQIRQSFSNVDIYPTLEEKAANLLYFVTKNHSFVDGNKRIAAACFLLFLKDNNFLYNKNDVAIISNDTLATLTLFIATSRPEEDRIVKRLIISILNRNINSGDNNV